MTPAVQEQTTPAPEPTAPLPAAKLATVALPSKHLPGRPLIQTQLTADEAARVIDAAGPLGGDPGCAPVSNRTKSVGFFIFVADRWLQLDKSSFIDQLSRPAAAPAVEHDFTKLPASFITCGPTTRLLNAFRARFSVPDGAPVLVQVQALDVMPDDDGEFITGQAAHTDGGDCSMVVCLARRNVAGARNTLVADVAAENPVVAPFELAVGDAIMWDDNRVYHAVEPMCARDVGRPANRTVLLANYPATQYITGAPNPNNKLTDVAGHCETENYKYFTRGFSAFSNSAEESFSRFDEIRAAKGNESSGSSE